MKRLVAILVLVAVPCLLAFTEERDLYDELRPILPDTAWEWKESEFGIDVHSRATFEDPDGNVVSAIFLSLEGPIALPPGTTIDDLMNQQVHVLTDSGEVEGRFDPEDPQGEGFGGTKVDVNGRIVGYLWYRLASYTKAKVRRAMILEGNKLYGFTMMIHDHSQDPRQGMLLDALVIAAVNSGKL